MTPQSPERETRQSIERELAGQRRGYRRALQTAARRSRAADSIAAHLAKLREVLDPESFAKVQSQFLRGTHRLSVQIRKDRRRPGEGSMPALVEPPRGPKPLNGGAAAPLDF